ncbi:MAG: cation:proton antiporter [Endomicrobium sp.]|nr:cation:proton antiporter [Endomicrobium sp.]
MHDMFGTLVSLASIFFFAKIFGEIALKFGQTEIIGELLAGILIGPSVLGFIHETSVLSFVSELGAIILLFEVGLSMNLKEFLKASGWAMVVAFIGVIIPYFLGYFVFLYYGFTNTHAIFAGAVLTATSVGITARVFVDLKCLKSDEAKIVLGAALIDDVVGLVMLAIVLKLVTVGEFITLRTIVQISGVAISFLILSVVLGLLIVQKIFKRISAMRQVHTVFIAGAFFCFVISALSIKAGLAPIVGAFVAGLVLSTTKQSEEIRGDVKPVYAFFVPVFFVLMGTNVDICIFNPSIVANREILFLIIILFIVAFVGKTIAGFAVIKKGINKLLIGVSMVPRGEVGLIFVDIGFKNNVFEKQDYSTLVAVIMLTTFVTPILLKYICKKPPNV